MYNKMYLSAKLLSKSTTPVSIEDNKDIITIKAYLDIQPKALMYVKLCIVVRNLLLVYHCPILGKEIKSSIVLYEWSIAFRHPSPSCRNIHVLSDLGIVWSRTDRRPVAL